MMHLMLAAILTTPPLAVTGPTKQVQHGKLITSRPQAMRRESVTYCTDKDHLICHTKTMFFPVGRQ